MIRYRISRLIRKVKEIILLLRHREGYTILSINGHEAIKCHTCGRISHNYNDVRYRYCGCCHKYHKIKPF